MSLSRREIDDLRQDLEKISTKVLGSVDDRVIAVFERGLYNGYDKEKYVTKLTSVVEERKALKLADKLDSIIYRDSPKSKKRHYDADDGHDANKKSKTKHDDSEVTEASSLSSSQIRQMMENAQRQIEERKRKIEEMKDKLEGPLDPASDERQRKIAELQRQIQAKLSGSLGGVLQQPVFTIIQKPIDKPRPLILDEEGRTVDKSGREISIQTLTPTLKANIRAKKKETFKHQQVEKTVEEAKNRIKRTIKGFMTKGFNGDKNCKIS